MSGQDVVDESRLAPLVVVAMWVPTFEMSAPVVRELRHRGVPVEIVAVPERTADGGYLLDQCRATHAWLVENGWDPLPLVQPENEAQRLRELEPCAVILSTPYDFQRHPSLAADELGLPLHDIGYFHRVAPDTVGGGETFMAYYDGCDSVYCGSAAERDQFVAAGLDPRIPVLTGHPALDRWDEDWELASAPTVVWAPWHIRTMLDGSRGYCTFLEARADMLAAMRARPSMRFIIRPHPLMFEDIEDEWSRDEERAFREEVASLPNVTLVDAANSSPEEEIGRAWGMITDGLSFIVDFACTGKPLLLTEAPDHPGWSPVGEALRADVETALVEDGIPGLDAFLDRVARGIDPVEVAARRTAVTGVLHRPAGGAAVAVADHVERCRQEELANRGMLRVAAGPVTTAEKDALAALAAAAGEARSYQVHLLDRGALPWTDGRTVRAEVLAGPRGLQGLAVLIDDGLGSVLLTGPVWDGWPLTGLARDGRVYDLEGRDLGEADEVLGRGSARRIARASFLGGPRTVLVGAGGLWAQMWNQLPVVCSLEPQIASLVEEGSVHVRVAEEGMPNLNQLGGLHGLLPSLASRAHPWVRRWHPAGLVPLAGTRVTAALRERVHGLLGSRGHAGASAPKLWVGLSGQAGDDPVNMAQVISELTEGWLRLGGAEVLVDVMSGHADRESMQRALTCDVALVSGPEPSRVAVWLAGLPTVAVVGPGRKPRAVGEWFAAQVAEPPVVEAVPSDLLVPWPSGYMLAEGAAEELSERLMGLAAGPRESGSL